MNYADKFIAMIVYQDLLSTLIIHNKFTMFQWKYHDQDMGGSPLSLVQLYYWINLTGYNIFYHNLNVDSSWGAP